MLSHLASRGCVVGEGVDASEIARAAAEAQTKPDAESARVKRTEVEQARAMQEAMAAAEKARGEDASERAAAEAEARSHLKAEDALEPERPDASRPPSRSQPSLDWSAYGSGCVNTPGVSGTAQVAAAPPAGRQPGKRTRKEAAASDSQSAPLPRVLPHIAAWAEGKRVRKQAEASDSQDARADPAKNRLTCVLEPADDDLMALLVSCAGIPPTIQCAEPAALALPHVLPLAARGHKPPVPVRPSGHSPFAVLPWFVARSPPLQAPTPTAHQAFGRALEDRCEAL
jgi:hypothetical protein